MTSPWRVAFLCPGQGAQFVGMGCALAESDPHIRAMYEEADDVVGEHLSRICFEGPDAELVKTVNTQPALLLHSVAAMHALRHHGIRAAAAAGHSLGEYSAHVAVGSLTWQDALRLVRRRGELMYEAGLRNPGAMAAILGLAADAIGEVCAAVTGEGRGVVQPANLNSPGQVVISGDVSAVERAMALAKERGAKRAIRLEVSGAFHSPLMAYAADGLREAIASTAIRDAEAPVYANVSSQPVHTAQEIADALAQQLLGAVRWEESMRAMVADGYRVFVEVGSGKVLKGLMRQIAPDVEVLNVDDPVSADATVVRLSELAGSHAGEVH
jgi:[acyl-carrier-protein] S-malonyltransferase